ncbi:MAG TPA: hypothetical protein VKH46_10135 [Thermoanaerobaculia bacterium]|nr:hypothetical protein [Thermoanaerobaculia bacterium]
MKWKWLTLAIAGISAAVFGGFPATESYLPAVGRLAGEGGAQFYTTMWATNLTGAPVSFTFEFLKEGQANPSPASFTDTLSPGQTKMYENVVESRLGLSDALGAARIRASGEMLVAERIYDQAPGDDLGNTQGLFFAGVPKSFSISLGQSASIQGVSQGGSENFRYNFALVETGGGSPTVNVQLFDGDGALLGQKAYAMGPHEQLQPNVKDLASTVSTINARITATVTGGTGSVLLAGAQVANESQDSSGFEMSFRDDLLGSGAGTAGVTSLNGSTGALTIAHGANTTVNVNGSTITIDAVSGSGTGLTAVAHDNSLLGSGTVSLPLGIANGQVVRSLNGLHDAVALAAGTNVTITPSGNTLTIAASGGGSSGFTLPYSATVTTSNPAFKIENDGSGAAFAAVTQGTAISAVGGGGHLAIPSRATVEAAAMDNSAFFGTSDSGAAFFGSSGSGTAIDGRSGSGTGVHGSGVVGVLGEGTPGVQGNGGSTGDGVDGFASNAGRSGVYGSNAGSGAGVFGRGAAGDGVHGETTGANPAAGVKGKTNNTGYGVYGTATGTGGAAIGGDAPNGGKAAHFYGGDVYIDNNLHVTKAITAGTKDFKIDHPLDPANEYLVHASIESSEMVNIYSGNVVLDGHGVAAITLPAWMEAENADFRYQLTAVGLSQAGLYVAQEVRDHRFVVAGGSPGGKVSWQITGVRRDRWALANPLVVEEKKPANERGLYLHPEAYGLRPEKRIGWSEDPRNPARTKAEPR